MYELNRLAVFRYTYALTGGSQEDAEDLTAETFLRAWKARHHFQGEMDVAICWLIGIAKRLVVDDYRRTIRATCSQHTDIQTELMPEQAAIMNAAIDHELPYIIHPWLVHLGMDGFLYAYCCSWAAFHRLQIL